MSRNVDQTPPERTLMRPSFSTTNRRESPSGAVRKRGLLKPDSTSCVSNARAGEAAMPMLSTAQARDEISQGKRKDGGRAIHTPPIEKHPPRAANTRATMG